MIDRSGTPRKLGLTWLTILGCVLWIAVIASIIAAMAIVGSPAQAKREKEDVLRVSDMESLARALQHYFAKHKALPATQDLAYSSLDVSPINPKDPETGNRYEYRVVDKAHFELSATFRTDQSKFSPRTYSGDPSIQLPFSKHKSGHQHFLLDAKSASP